MRGRAARRLPLVAGRSWPGGLCMGLAACLLRKKASGGGAMVKSGCSTGSWAQVVCPIASRRLSSRVSTNVSYHENLKK